MKRFFSFLALVLACSILWAQDARKPPAAASLPLDFGVTLADLFKAAKTGDDRAIPGGRTLIIDADIGSITVRADTDQRFVAEVELVGGAWKGEDAVELYRAYAVFDGLKYRDLFSTQSTDRIQPGSHVLIPAQYLGLGVDYDEKTPVAVVEGLGLRTDD